MNGSTGITWQTLWQALAVIVPLGFGMLVSHIRLSNRIIRLETRAADRDEYSAAEKQAAENLRALELAAAIHEHMVGCPARWPPSEPVQTSSVARAKKL